ncbi:acetyltransferase-like isoleucine patch superfamily enzyme [Pedobacter sp. UYP24]
MGILFRLKRVLKILLKKLGLFRVFPNGSSIHIAEDFRIGLYPSITVSNKSTVVISSNVEMRRYCNVIVEENAQLIIEENVFLNNYCSINCHDRIRIGSNTIIGEGVKFYDHNHKYTLNPSLDIFKDQFTKAEINIGSNCWIGSNVIILKGVIIGDNVIVGANCLIFKSIASNSIVRSKSELLINDITEGNG